MWIWIWAILVGISAIFSWRTYLKTRRPIAMQTTVILALAAIALLIFSATRAP